MTRLRAWLRTDLDQYFNQPNRPLISEPWLALGVLLAMVAVGLFVQAASMELQYGYQLGIKLAGAGSVEPSTNHGQPEGAYINLIKATAAAIAAIVASCACFWLHVRNNRRVE